MVVMVMVMMVVVVVMADEVVQWSWENCSAGAGKSLGGQCCCSLLVPGARKLGASRSTAN